MFYWKPAQPVECLLHRREQLHSIPRLYIKVWLCWYTRVIPAVGREKQADLWISRTSYSGELSVFRVNERPCVKTRNTAAEEQHLTLISGLYTHSFIYLHPVTHTEEHTHTYTTHTHGHNLIKFTSNNSDHYKNVTS